jgi:hypothetical protein
MNERLVRVEDDIYCQERIRALRAEIDERIQRHLGRGPA